MNGYAKYSIGIDLGTTNCALSFVSLAQGDSESRVFSIPQLDELHTEVERSSLPSFLYRAEDSAEVEKGDWLAGRIALNRSRERPERVIQSAKSWLCHHAVSPEAKILPWKSAAVAEAEKLSPIEATARLLRHLKDAWERRFSMEAPLVQQRVIVTVPASFDAAAQRATLDAAAQAGFPADLRLLEEPQAAFYRWLEQWQKDGTSRRLSVGESVLVVDVGGGTSDFSFFRVTGFDAVGWPRFERLAVSDHLLLGGDNIDLALAYALESELSPDGEELSVDQWGHLIGRARALKEQCLGQADQEDVKLRVSLPSRGAGLFAGSLSTEVSSQEVRELLLDGFFPNCPATAKAERTEAGLVEWGLPYANDCAVTRHLAEFLSGKGKVDYVLFNGGTLTPKLLQERMLSLVGEWQGGDGPRYLENAETDLAVARGAARYGATVAKGRSQIESGAARALYIGVGTVESQKLMCVLPKGTPLEKRIVTEAEGLQLKLNRRARFQLFQAKDAVSGVAGELLDGERRADFRILPPVEAEIVDERGEGYERVPVRIQTALNEVGTLTVSCEEVGGEGSWTLAFNLRAEVEPATDPLEGAASDGISEERLTKAATQLKRRLLSGEKASRIFKGLEESLGRRRHEWDLESSRILLGGCFEAAPALSRRDEAAASWMQVAGYLMRPGFGASGDEERLARMEKELEAIPKLTAQLEVQWLILWRRIAPGLSEARQHALFDMQLGRLRATKRAQAERLRLLGSLERVDVRRKNELFGELTERLEREMKAGGYLDPLLSSLGSLASRFLFRAGPDRALVPDCVAALFKLLENRDWASSRFAAAVPLFLSASRIVDDRSLDVPPRVRSRILRKLEKSGVAANRMLPLRDYVPISREERADAYGESLPPGLAIG